MQSKKQTMCSPGYYQSVNGVMVTHALGHFIYGDTLLAPMHQRVFNKSTGEHHKSR